MPSPRHCWKAVLPFLLLYTIGGLRGYRLRTLRHANETSHLEKWMALAFSGVFSRIFRARELVEPTGSQVPDPFQLDNPELCAHLSNHYCGAQVLVSPSE